MAKYVNVFPVMQLTGGIPFCDKVFCNYDEAKAYLDRKEREFRNLRNASYERLTPDTLNLTLNYPKFQTVKYRIGCSLLIGTPIELDSATGQPLTG